MRDFKNELNALREEVAEMQRNQAMLQTLLQQDDACRQEMERCRAQKDKEQADVDRLERVSLASVFHKIAGNTSEALDKEKAEAYAAALKYESAKRRLDEITSDIEFRKSEISRHEDCLIRYDRVLHEKVDSIKANDSHAAQLLGELEERIAYLTAQRRELQEALAAGADVLTELQYMQKELNSAGGWSTFDLLGGGLISDIAKYSHLDEAEKCSDMLQSRLRRYQAELSDVTIAAEFDIRIDGFLTAVDIWFDNIFTDWAVRDRISNSQAQVNQTQSQVYAVQERLAQQLDDVGRELAEKEQQWTAVAEAD